MTGRKRRQVWRRCVTTGGNPVCLPKWYFNLSCGHSTSFFFFPLDPFRLFSPPEIGPGTLRQHWLWHTGSDWGSDGTLKEASSLRPSLPALWSTSRHTRRSQQSDTLLCVHWRHSAPLWWGHSVLQRSDLMQETVDIKHMVNTQILYG